MALRHGAIAGGIAIATLINVLAITISRAEIRITHDSGGDVRTYVARVDAARKSGERVVIDGFCGSACTIWLTLPPSQICVTPRAVFTFHTASTSLGLPDPKWNDALLKAWPPRVRYYVLKHGGLWLNPITVRGTAIANRC